jgi:hypothetical protein
MAIVLTVLVLGFIVAVMVAIAAALGQSLGTQPTKMRVSSTKHVSRKKTPSIFASKTTKRKKAPSLFNLPKNPGRRDASGRKIKGYKY